MNQPIDNFFTLQFTIYRPAVWKDLDNIFFFKNQLLTLPSSLLMEALIFNARIQLNNKKVLKEQGNCKGIECSVKVYILALILELTWFLLEFILSWTPPE